jgi:hypothetical protein
MSYSDSNSLPLKNTTHDTRWPGKHTEALPCEEQVSGSFEAEKKKKMTKPCTPKGRVHPPLPEISEVGIFFPS